MRTLNVDFGDSPFELAITRLRPGDSFPAGRFLTLLEGEDVAVRSGLYTFRNRQFLCLLGNVAGLLYQRAARQKQHQQQCTYKCGGFLHKIPSCSIVSF